MTMAAALHLAPFETPPPSRGFEASERPLDLVYLARQTAGDRALEVELLGLFDRQAALIAEKLAAPVADEHHDVLADLAHKLKGSARAVGANRVAAAAENYEYCARAGVLRPIDVKALVEAVAQVRAALRELAS
jgi:HPt (histidine-containing phosphotransfer) domain-containing protein